MSSEPLLVVVTGMPAAGKTTIAEPLARTLGLPLVARDAIKERLYETLGTRDVEWSERLGGAAFALLFDVAALLLGAGHGIVVEANFFRGHAEPRFAALPEHRVVQIHCAVPLETLAARYAKRLRHEGHHDSEKAKLLPERFAARTHDPLDLPGDLIRVDTTHPVDAGTVAAQVQRLLRSPRQAPG